MKRTLVGIALSACATGSAACGGPADAPAGRSFNAPAMTGAADGKGTSKASGDDFAFAKENRDDPGRAQQKGMATWYGTSFAGKKTSSGERFDPRAMTAAHRTLPFGTWVEVRRVDTGTTVRVRINDRGPHGNASTIIDLSQAAAERLHLVQDGIGRVELRVVHGGE